MKRIIGAVILLLGIMACNKKVSKPVIMLQIDMKHADISVDDIDSADVVFLKENSSEQVTMRLVKTNQVLETDINSLAAGAWTAEVEVYTNAVAHESLQYVSTRPVTVENTPATIQWDGPKLGNGWVKRRVKATDGNSVVVIFSDNVYDPYFEFRLNELHVSGFGVQRTAINNNYLVAFKRWSCGSACLSNQRIVINNSEFKPFTETIYSQPWTKNEISITVFDQSTNDMLDWDFTWQ